MQAELIDEGAGRLHVRFTNETDATQWLAPDRALLQSKPGYSFLRTAPSATWRGPIIKRLPYSRDELVAVAPGQVVDGDSFTLIDWYRFEEASGLVTLRYQAGHPLDGTTNPNGGTYDHVESPEIQVRLDA